MGDRCKECGQTTEIASKSTGACRAPFPATDFRSEMFNPCESWLRPSPDFYPSYPIQLRNRMEFNAFTDMNFEF